MVRVLVINCGSSSVRYQVLDPSRGTVHARGKIERIGEGRTHQEALAEMLAAVRGHQIDAVGHRVVHGGEHFHDATRIDDAVVAAIEGCVRLAPLHNPANLAGIRAAREAFPNVPHVAVFDTAFHARLPRRARTYAIDPELAAKHAIRRYGFHGTSHAYVAHRAAEYLGRRLEDLRVITCHLGNGASVSAIEFGHPVDTSMGMTPLEGLVMGTRSGDLDPGVVLQLLRAESPAVDDVEHILRRESGLKGLSGIGEDMRDIEAAAASGNDRARLAIAVFVHRVRKYIGAYASVMGGVDAVVLTGGIGENSASMRERILNRFDFLGLIVDEHRNQDAKVTHQHPVTDVSTPNARVRALVAATNEELMIARESAAVVAGKTQVSELGPIPIAISARHAHLDHETLEKLFGKGAKLTPARNITQPGQYACKESVNLVGPRGRINGVRVIGPLRERTQVEISRTDEFHLGVDAPIRRSGVLDGSAPITLEGATGTVQLEEGLICAHRHIHMTPEDAERFGVKAGDEVDVAVTGGPRELVFGDVLIRVSPSYKLEMHIDTDEGNAAELPRLSDGALVFNQVSGTAHADIRAKRLREL
jgi:acetate kinase